MPKIKGQQLVGTYPVTRDNNGTIVQEPAAKILTGWGAVTTTAAYAAIEDVWFNTPFTSPPVVTITMGGDATSGTAVALGNGGNNVHGAVTAKVTSVAADKFTAFVFQTQGTNYPAGATVYYHWIAIGV